MNVHSRSPDARFAVAFSRGTQRQASLEAEKVQQQASLDLERARLEATLAKLTIEKEAAAAIAEAEVLEAAAYPDSEHSRHSNVLGLEQDPKDALQRTSEYVLQHSISNSQTAQETKEIIREPSQTHQTLRQEADLRPQFCKQENDTAQVNFPAHQRTQPPFQYTGSFFTPKRYGTGEPEAETPNRYDHTPHSHHGNVPPTCLSTNQATIDFAKFFAQRELVTKGLVKFSDNPENSRAWRSSLQNVIRDLDLSCREELDLLVKWLGNESAEHAKRIRAININYPETGLKMIWDRLDECYGSAEVIESALFKRIDDFPKIASKGYQKLRELSDLLMELEVAKAEGDLLGLAFLDTARGVNPIIQKLPYNLQEKWVTHGSRYKQIHNVPFPPFSVFVEFITQQARIRNDPSFDLTLSCATPSGFKQHKTPVAVHKTNVSLKGYPYRSSSSSHQEDRFQDPSKQCPLHKKPHSLLKCRAFREKSMEDRNFLLRENKICYKCCLATSHFAKDCKVSVKCTECDSTDHNTALHPGPPPWTHAVSAQEQGGEEMNTDTETPAVTSQCTEVCKGLIGGRSCSKICLVRVYPTGHKDKAIKVYAILDDQSNKSLARSTFFEIFKIKRTQLSLLPKDLCWHC
ncbi:uncharacterized protein LOC142651849 [Rhinoderma darwinii]|uniref:uncharacterized protein LOC142651849 n=1 Tax=Rhinoderma darwinii TaxID=43563 RepID=UPI003F664253